MRRLRVVHVLSPAGFGGCERHLLDLLPALRARGHDVGLLLMRRPGQAHIVEAFRGCGVELDVMDAGPLVNPSAPAGIGRRLRVLRPDVVHTHSPGGDFYGQLATTALRIPSVSSVHGTYPFYGRPPYRLAAKVAWMTCARTIAISRHVAEFLVRMRLVRRGRLEVVPYSVDPARWTPNRPSERANVVLGVASRLVDRKGHHVLIDAVAKARAVNADIALRVAGEGPLRTELERHAAAVAPDAVSFCGFVDDIAEFLSAVDVLVFPTERGFGEGFGLAVLEGMAAGLPVIASRIDAIPELIKDGVSGILVPPSDTDALASAVVRLAADAGLRARLGAGAHRRAVEAFPLDKMVDRIESVYQKAVP